MRGDTFSRMSNKQKAILLLFVGGIFVFGGLLRFVGNIQFQLRAHSTAATIVDVVKTSGRYTSYTATVKFRDVDNVEHEVTITSNTAPGGVGDQARILYDYKNPSDARLNSGIDLDIAPLLFVAFGIIVIFGGLFFLRKRQRATP